MIRLWTYNELAADIDTQDISAELFLPRPGTASSKHKIQIDTEIIEASAWDAWSLANIIAGTNVGIGASVDATKPLRRGLRSTKAQRHKKGAPAWIEWLANETDAEGILAGNTVTVPAGNGRILEASSDGYGGWYVGGNYTTIGGVGKLRCARISAVGEIDTAFVADFDNQVSQVYYDPSRDNVIIGGVFTTHNGSSVGKLIVVNGRTGALVQDLNVPAGGVNSVIIEDDIMYVGGNFSSAGGVSRQDVCSYEFDSALNQWVITTWDPNVTGGQVLSLAITDEYIYAGGSLTAAGGTTRNRAAAWNKSDGTLTDWDPNTNGSIFYVAPYDGNVFLAGDFTTVNGASQEKLAKVDGEFGELDAVFTATPDDDCYSVVIHHDTVYVTGDFLNIDATARQRVAGLDPDTGVLNSVSLTFDNVVDRMEVSGDKFLFTGLFTNNLKCYQANLGFSPIGRYKAELELELGQSENLESVLWRVYSGFGDLIYEGEELIEFQPSETGVIVSGPEISLPNPNLPYQVEATITKSSGVTTEKISFGGRSIDAIYLIPIGVESGDRFDESDGLTMPSPSNPSKAGTTYTLSLPDQADTPTAMNDHYFYRLFAILGGDSTAYKGGNRFTMDRSIGPVTEIVNTSYTNLYEAEIDWSDQNASFTLTLTFEDALGSATISVTPTHPGASSNFLNPDQVQIEREAYTGVLTGPEFGRFISDWIPVPGSFQIQYANQGPAAYTYRYRCRYRDFRRDGVDDERGPVEITSAWSDWTPLV